MTEPATVIRALRQAVQDFDRPGVSIGEPFPAVAARWLAQKLGFNLPTAYLQLLAAHNGAVLADPVYLSFYASLEVLVIYHRDWADPARFWPVSGDGCGNYHCLDVTRSDGIDCPVVFFETTVSSAEPSADSADSVHQFILDQVNAQRSRLVV